MKCKYCNEEINDEHKFCPFCGKNLTDEEIFVDAQEEPQNKRKVWPIVASIAGAVIALSALAVVLLVALGVDFKWLLPRGNDIHYKDAYTVSDENAEKNANTVIATVNGKELTNIQLQIYYRMQVTDFLNYYGDYISYAGLDLSKPLSEQTCKLDETMTWEQYFLDVALKTWHNYQTMALLAEESGHVLGDDWKESLDKLPDDLKKQAEEGKYESVDALLKDVIGPGCDQENYMKYVTLLYTSNDYYGTEYERLTPKQEEIDKYFADNKETFEKQGITKESGLISAVRHILISPKGGTKDETTGKTTYSDAEWADALKEAEKVLKEWKDGEATEVSFSKLAGKYTADTGSASTGGLYEDIFKGSGMVEEFEAWCIDTARKEGDTGIVKSPYGYHIMYFVSGEPYWSHSAKNSLLSELTSKMIEDAQTKWPLSVNYKKITLAEVIRSK